MSVRPADIKSSCERVYSVGADGQGYQVEALVFGNLSDCGQFETGLPAQK
jgi:hypothetical protein